MTTPESDRLNARADNILKEELFQGVQQLEFMSSWYLESAG